MRLRRRKRMASTGVVFVTDDRVREIVREELAKAGARTATLRRSAGDGVTVSRY